MVFSFEMEFGELEIEEESDFYDVSFSKECDTEFEAMKHALKAVENYIHMYPFRHLYELRVYDDSVLEPNVGTHRLIINVENY